MREPAFAPVSAFLHGARASPAAPPPRAHATWSLVGFYGALGPTLVRRISGSSSIALGGFSLFVFAASGALAVLLTRPRTPQALMLGAMAALIGGVALTLFGIRHTSTAWLFAGIVLAGGGFGAGFQGAVRTVVPLAGADQRAGVLSILYVIAYLSMGLPAVLGGFRVVHGGGLLGTAREFGDVVIALAALAWRARCCAAGSPSAGAGHGWQFGDINRRSSN